MLVYALVAILVLLAAAITFTIGWRPFVGPAARPLTDRRFESTPERMARGAYLVNAVVGCVGCHSERDWSNLDLPKPGMEGAGDDWSEEVFPTLVASNITPDRETGIGAWSDDALARAIREGVNNEGRALFPIMPYPNLRNMSDEDLASVIVYIRSLAPIRRSLPETQLPFPLSRFVNLVPEPLTGPVPHPDLSTPEKRGRYLVTIGSCTDCHTPMDEQGRFLPGMTFAGGAPFKTPDGTIHSANITQAPSGIPYYTEDLFVQVMRTGNVGGRAISPAMPWGYYRNMTDEDLRAIFAYVKTFAPVSHRVDNSKPPTPCPRCGQTHGAGDQNTAPD
jgi:mono/diheme cytochrome c family protein